MYQTFIEKFSELFSKIHPVFLFSFVIILGLYIFWRGCWESRKNNTSIFDVFFLSFVVGLFTGRVSYIITHWSDFSSFFWYWLPYEKYGNEIFWFRVLPWRFFRFWDWGIDILLMFVGFLTFAGFWVIFVKKWKWSELFTTIFFTAQSMLGMSFFLLGGVTKNIAWITQGLVMILLPFVLFLLKNSVKAVMIGSKEEKVLTVLDTFFTLLLVIYTTYVYLSIDISDIERGGVVFFLVWTVFGIILNIAGRKKKGSVTIERVSSVREVSSIDINQPIKLPK